MNKESLRKVTYLDEYGEQYEGLFHKWILHDGVQTIVEDIYGRIELVDYKDIQFQLETIDEMF